MVALVIRKHKPALSRLVQVYLGTLQKMSFKITKLLRDLRIFNWKMYENFHLTAKFLKFLCFSGAAVTNLVIHYEKFGEPLEMWMEEDGVVSKAKIPSQECVDTLYFDFSKPNIMSKGMNEFIPRSRLLFFSSIFCAFRAFIGFKNKQI